MSLINKMLQDLDARGGKPGAATGQQAVRPVAVPQRQMRPVLMGVAAVAVGAALAGGWYGWHYFDSHTVKARPGPAMVVAPPAPAVAPGVAAVPAPAVAPGGAPVPVPMPAPVTVSAPARASAPVSAPAPAPVSNFPRASGPVPASAVRAGVQAVPVSSGEADDSRPARPARKPGHAREAAERVKVDGAGAAVAGRGKQTESRAKAVDRNADSQAGGVVRDLGPAQLAENRYRLGLRALQDGRVSEALAQLQHAVEIDPHHEAARQTLVTLLIENHWTDEAAQQLQEALALNPRQPGMAMLLARLQLENGGPALDTLMRTLPYAGDNAEYQGFVAGVLQRAQRHGEAVEHYQAALKLAPQKGVWWMGLGISLQAEKRPSEARAAYNRARAASGMTPELQAFVDRKLEALGR
jgi:MSHA biogenesis protein MshN